VHANMYATMYGGAERPWALTEVYPISRMMAVRNTESLARKHQRLHLPTRCDVLGADARARTYELKAAPPKKWIKAIQYVHGSMKAALTCFML
jgi:hypothetical protein